MLNLVFHNSTSAKKYNSKFFEKILKTAIREIRKHEKPQERERKESARFSMSVNLVEEKKIRELNKKYRDKNKPTDVLSFPLQEKLEIGNWKLESPKSKTLVFDLGDIFICLSIAKNDAKRENITIEEKLKQLTAHGFLHLQGYEHEKSKRGAEEMFGLERRIFEKLNSD